MFDFFFLLIMGHILLVFFGWVPDFVNFMLLGARLGHISFTGVRLCPGMQLSY